MSSPVSIRATPAKCGAQPWVRPRSILDRTPRYPFRPYAPGVSGRATRIRSRAKRHIVRLPVDDRVDDLVDPNGFVLAPESWIGPPRRSLLNCTKMSARERSAFESSMGRYAPISGCTHRHPLGQHRLPASISSLCLFTCHQHNQSASEASKFGIIRSNWSVRL